MNISKKITILTVCMVMIFGAFMMTGCGGRVASAKDIEFLTASEYWYHYDEVTGEYEKMSFHDDFTFYWGCECGEPVGDSDCYELFDYDKDTGSIRLYNDYDDMNLGIKVIDYSDYHILLKMDGKIKDYVYAKTYLDIADSEKYLDGYSGEFAVLGGDKENVDLGPFDYDGDIEYDNNAVKTYELSDDFEAYALNLFKHIIDGEVVENKVDYKSLTMDEVLENMEYSGYGFIWFDDELKVSKILFYGDSIFEE